MNEMDQHLKIGMCSLASIHAIATEQNVQFCYDDKLNALHFTYCTYGLFAYLCSKCIHKSERSSNFFRISKSNYCVNICYYIFYTIAVKIEKNYLIKLLRCGLQLIFLYFVYILIYCEAFVFVNLIRTSCPIPGKKKALCLMKNVFQIVI